ncbi:alpha/beta-hydrolase [Lentinus tigrinus ALCF2SS1-7]|uniref:alpha/beta-hydrolase n=1 Tax=Lentinus tigrinus ALCF2SS1-7 TaxID=1328758 RepID=UPI0011663B67|nr:alpha/beta-hydrolase [Lentinus tigrinus ALCF2SS1-7]
MPPAIVVKTPRSADGTRIHAEAVGNPRNPHVVFIHEATLCCLVYDELFQDARLTDHLYLVRYDLRCHGRSGITRTAESQHSSLYASDFAAVAGAFGLHRPIIVAWGFGAAVVADICAHINPPPIAGIVYIAPLPFLGPTMTQLITPRMLGIAQTLITTHDTATSGRAKTDFVNGVVAGSACRVPDTMKAAWLGRSILQDAEVTAHVLSRTHDPVRLLELGRQGLPLLVLVGADDALVDGGAVVRELRRHFRNAETHVVPGSSHALFVDHRDEFVGLLLVFVGRLAVMTLMG